MTTCCCLQLATLACEVWHAHCQYPSFPPCTRLGALAKPSKLCNPPEAPRTPQPVAPPTNTELGRVGARCCEVWSAACVENIDSRMGLEPLDEGLRLRDRLCVEKEGRDTPAMLTCESRASLATTPAAFASESLATVARESSAATSDTAYTRHTHCCLRVRGRCRLQVVGGDIRHRRLRVPGHCCLRVPGHCRLRDLGHRRLRVMCVMSASTHRERDCPGAQQNKRGARGHRPPQGAGSIRTGT